MFLLGFGDDDQILLTVSLLVSCLATIASTLVVAFCIVRRRRRRKTHPLQKPVLSEIDILNALKDSKVFPVEYSNGWKLHDYVNGQQLWSHDLHMAPSSSQPPSPSQPPSLPSAAAEQQQHQQQEMATVFACFSKVKGSPQMVLNILKDVQKFDHWTLHPRRPLLRSTDSSIPAAAHESSSSRNSLTGGGGGRQVAPSVCHDVISILATDPSSASTSSSPSTSSSSSGFVFRRLLKRLMVLDSLLRRTSVSSPAVTSIQRFWQREENGCCWLLEYEAEAEEWNFCLMQPIEGWFETDRCLLTLMSSFGGETETPHHEEEQQRRRRGLEAAHCARLAVKISSVRDYLQHRRIQTVPLVRLSLSYPDTEAMTTTPTTDGSSGGGGLGLTSPENCRSKDSKGGSSSSKDPSQDVSLLQKFKNMIELKRETYEVEKRRKAARAMSSTAASVTPASSGKQDAPPANATASSASSSASSSSIQSPFDLLRKLSPSKSFDQLRSGAGKVDPAASSATATAAAASAAAADDAKRLAAEQTTARRRESAENGGEGKAEGGKEEQKPNGSNSTLRRRMPLLNEIGRSRSVKSSPGDAALNKEPEFSEKKVVEEKDVDEKKERGGSSSEELTEGPTSAQEDSELESRLKLIAEATVADLIAEKSRVSQLNITSSYKEQAKATGGWTYNGLEKDTVILQKEVDDEHPIHSYLGKGMVPASPKTVYEILRRPHNRKTYDNWLQKVQVLHEFQSGLKIVYMYHEGKESPKKNCHDLCLLQSEKCEGKRYIISLQSVDWPTCKELENVARVKMSSSGWIIEPVVKGKDVFSMITYITQMELGSNQGGSDYLEEFAAKQPVCIISLRQYVTTLNDTTTSSEHLTTTDCPRPLHSSGRNTSLPSTAY